MRLNRRLGGAASEFIERWGRNHATKRTRDTVAGTTFERACIARRCIALTSKQAQLMH